MMSMAVMLAVPVVAAHLPEMPVPSLAHPRLAGIKEAEDNDFSDLDLHMFTVQYDDLPPTLPRRAKHVRSESISTTASEIEFRKRYQAKTRRIVQRKSSTQTYQRMSERFYGESPAYTLHYSTLLQ